MLICPKCSKREFDVTGEGIPPNPLYRCWNCDFECFKNQFKKYNVNIDRPIIISKEQLDSMSEDEINKFLESIG